MFYHIDTESKIFRKMSHIYILLLEMIMKCCPEESFALNYGCKYLKCTTRKKLQLNNKNYIWGNIVRWDKHWQLPRWTLYQFHEGIQAAQWEMAKPLPNLQRYWSIERLQPPMELTFVVL